MSRMYLQLTNRITKLATNFYVVAITFLTLLAFVCCACGAQAMSTYGDAVTDQYVSPVGSYTDMGSLFAAVLIVGSVAVGHTLDNRKGGR